jgi:hypothetical protein
MVTSAPVDVPAPVVAQLPPLIWNGPMTCVPPGNPETVRVSVPPDQLDPLIEYEFCSVESIGKKRHARCAGLS